MTHSAGLGPDYKYKIHQKNPLLALKIHCWASPGSLGCRASSWFGLPHFAWTNVKFLPSCFFETQMYRMETGTLRMGILKTKGLRPLVQNRFPFATKMPIRNIPFSKIRGILELNQTKSANRRTDRRINEVRALPLKSRRELFYTLRAGLT